MLGWMKLKLESKLPGEYQQPQICRWYHPYGRKRRGTKEPLDEGERGEWKIWLKTQHSKAKIMASSPITSWQIDGKQWKQWQIFIFLGCEITADGDCSHEINICLFLGRKVMTNLESVIKKQIHYFANKDLYTQSYGFSSSHVWMWEFYHKGWPQQNWCFWTVVLEKALESPLDCKEIQPVNPKGNQF